MTRPASFPFVQPNSRTHKRTNSPTTFPFLLSTSCLPFSDFLRHSGRELFRFEATGCHTRLRAVVKCRCCSEVCTAWWRLKRLCDHRIIYPDTIILRERSLAEGFEFIQDSIEVIIILQGTGYSSPRTSSAKPRYITI